MENNTQVARSGQKTLSSIIRNNLSSIQSQGISKTGSSPKVRELRSYPPIEFASACGVQLETELMRVDSLGSLSRLPNSYSLNVIKEAYNEGFAVEFIKMHIISVNEFCSTKKIGDGQMQMLCYAILNGFGHINQYEFCKFCAMLKMGRFGTFFDSIDPQRIMKALGDFDMMCKQDIERIEEREEMARKASERIRHDKEAVTFDEWVKMNGGVNGDVLGVPLKDAMSGEK